MKVPTDRGGCNTGDGDGVIGADEEVGALNLLRGRRDITQYGIGFQRDEVLGWINARCERTNRGYNELKVGVGE